MPSLQRSHRPAALTLSVAGRHRFDCRVVEWTSDRIAVQPAADRSLWAPAMAPGSELEIGWSSNEGWTQGRSRVLRWVTAYVVEIEPPWVLEGRQRREAPRVPCSWPVVVTRLRPVPVSYEGQTIDVSTTGMAVRIDGHGWTVGEPVAVTTSTMGGFTTVAVAEVMGHDGQGRALRLRLVHASHADSRWWAELLGLLIPGAV